MEWVGPTKRTILKATWTAKRDTNMVRAKCPFCGEENHVGLFEEEHLGKPTAMMKPCEHFVFFSPTRYAGIQYVEQKFHIKFDTVSGGYSRDADLLRILNGYFKFVGPVAFASSEKVREDARRAVEEWPSMRKQITSRNRSL